MNFVTAAGYVKHGTAGHQRGSGAIGPVIFRISYMNFGELPFYEVE
jgi:hypothetical protein